MSDIFLSYSRDDQAIARRFAEGFEREGLSVWWDQTLHSGEAYDKVTEKALEEAKAVVVLWSKKSVDSRWVRAEATQAARDHKLVPVMIEPCKRPIMFELTHTADLSSWKGDRDDRSWQAYVADLRRIVGGHTPAAATVPAAVGGARRFNGLTLAISAAALLFAGIAVWSLRRAPTPPAIAPSASTTTVPAATTLAVLPFADMSPAKDQEYFSDGLTEEILNQLAQIKALRVTGRTSSFSFKNKNEDLRTIGDKLGVANLLEGSIRKDGNQLRITAQLINARDGSHLWSQTYDRELSKVFTVQEDVAKDVAKALSITLDVGDLSRAQGGTINVEAYDKYLRGKQLVLQDGSVEYVQGAQLLREAVKLDPAFTLAWMWLIRSLEVQLERDPVDPAALIAEGNAARARVLQLAPQSWAARQVRALQFMQARQWMAAERELQPGNADEPAAAFQVGFEVALEGFLTSVGRWRELMQLLERVRLQDPLSLTVSTDMQATLGATGRFKDAQAEYERSKSLQGDHGRADHFAFLRLLVQGASQTELRAALDTVLKTEPLPMDLTVALRDKLDKPDAARAAIRSALDVPGNQHPIRLFIIAAYADAYGDADTAAIALERSTRLSSGASVLHFIGYPFKTAVHSDPRYREMLRGLGLVDYWRKSGHWADFCKPVGTDDFECH